jgi:ABC-type glycerol-3-phosphate transport system substrate-binding protein
MNELSRPRGGRYTARSIGNLTVAFLLTALIGSSLATPASAATKVTTIKVLNWAPGGPAFWAATVKAFQKAHPTIKVKLLTVPFDKYSDVQGPYITSKSGPDVMSNNAGLELFDRRSAYVPLTADARKAGAQLLTYSGACLGFDVTKTCYALPFSYQGNVMYYNKLVLKAAGLDPAKPPTTMDQFDVACKAITAIGKTCLALGLTGVFPAYWDFPEIARNYLTEADIRNVLHGKMKWTNPKMVNILNGLAKLTNSGWTNSSAPSISMLPDAADIFSAGNAGFAGTILSDAVNWQAFGKAIGDQNLGAMLWPTINTKAPLAHRFSGIEGSVYGVTKWSKNKAAAFEFVKWMAGTTNGQLWTSMVGGQALNKRIDKSVLPKSPALMQIQKFISKPTLHVGVMLSGAEADALARGWQQVALKQITVEQWTTMMQAALAQSNKS